MEAKFNEMLASYQTGSDWAGYIEGGLSIVVGAAACYFGTAATCAAVGAPLILKGVDQIGSTGVNQVYGNSLQTEGAALQQLIANISIDIEAQQCWNSFTAQRGALVTAMTNIQIAVNDLGTQQIVLQNLGIENRQALQEGIAVLNQEEGSPLSSLGHQFWVDEKVEQFKKEFEWARRLAFLAMRAVEYEFQQSLPFRSQIVVGRRRRRSCRRS